ncbi:MAG: hypothetical protein ACLFVU_13500, partial [Phycisphaerae bacterium]
MGITSTKHAVARAVAWGDLLEAHAHRIYAVGIEPGVVHARALAASRYACRITRSTSLTRRW